MRGFDGLRDFVAVRADEDQEELEDAFWSVLYQLGVYSGDPLPKCLYVDGDSFIAPKSLVRVSSFVFRLSCRIGRSDLSLTTSQVVFIHIAAGGAVISLNEIKREIGQILINLDKELSKEEL